MNYRIRPARAEDVPQLPDIERAAGVLFIEAGVGGEVSVMPVAVLMTACEESRLLVIVDEGDLPVGFAVLKIIDGLGHLAEMDVHPAHCRRGLGSVLLQECLT